MAAKPYQLEVFPWFDVALGNLATIGYILSLVDSALVQYFEWATWIEFREPFSLWIKDIEWVSGLVIIFQCVRDWLTALPFAEEKRRDREHLEELLWRTTYDPSTNNWCFELLVVLFAAKSCLFRDGFLEYARDNISSVDELGETNGEPLHDYVMYLARALYLEKYDEEIRQILTHGIWKAGMITIVLAVMVSSQAAFEAAKQLVRTAERNTNIQTRRRVGPLELKDPGNVILAALVMPATSIMLTMDTALSMVALGLCVGKLFRRFYSDKLFSNYTSFTVAAQISLPPSYLFFSLVLVDVPILFAFFLRQEMTWLDLMVLVCFSMYSTALLDATKKLNQYRRLLANA